MSASGALNGPIPAIVLGGTGYVAGELLRLIAGHPDLKVAAILSDSQPGAPVAAAFPHLRSAYPDLKFAYLEQVETLLGRTPRCALFSAAPHGAAAAIIDRLLKAAESAGTRVHCVDISADFRYSSAAAYEAVYQHVHGAPERIAQFTCALLEHLQQSRPLHNRASGMLRDGHSARHRAVVGARAHRYAAVRDRHHRQHRLRPQAGRRHTSSSPA